MAMLDHKSHNTEPELHSSDTDQVSKAPNKKRSLAKRIVVGATGIAALGGAYFVGTNSGNENAAQTGVIAEAPSAPTTPNSTSSTSPETTRPTPDVQSVRRDTVGNIDALYWEPGDRYFTFTSPMGEKAKIPELGELDPNNPSEYMSHFFAIFSACSTDPTEQCLDAIGGNGPNGTHVRNLITQWHNNTIGRLVDGRIFDAQTSVWDEPDDPALFRVEESPNGTSTIRLDGGTLLLHYHDKQEWQSQEISNLYPDSLLTNRFIMFEMTVGPVDADGNSYPVSMNWDASEVYRQWTRPSN